MDVDWGRKKLHLPSNSLDAEDFFFLLKGGLGTLPEPNLKK